jgi:hypothetical protein
MARVISIIESVLTLMCVGGIGSSFFRALERSGAWVVCETATRFVYALFILLDVCAKGELASIVIHYMYVCINMHVIPQEGNNRVRLDFELGFYIIIFET